MDEHGLSQRQACAVVGLARSTARYVPAPDEEVIAVLLELAERFPERGFGELFQPVRRRGHRWNHKRVWRVYCAARLNQHRRGKRRLPNRTPVPLAVGTAVNGCWSADFMSDSL